MPQVETPEKCWVGEKEKICYETREEAEMAARLVEVAHGLEVGTLHVYKCEIGKHYHHARRKKKS